MAMPPSPVSVIQKAADDDLVTTAELAARLRLSTRSIYRYYAAGKIASEFTTSGGEHRWNFESVEEQLRQLRRRSE
jgi:predicted site-specific integrase-resolvase